MKMITVTGSMNAPDVLHWPVTGRMGDSTAYGIDGSIRMGHSKTGKWPPVQIADDGTLSEGNLWGVAEVDGKLYARTLHHIRPGQTDKNFPVNDWGVDREPLAFPGGYVLQPGQTVGLFCSTRARYGRSPINERTDIVWVKVGQAGIVEREGGEIPQPPPVEPPVPPVEPPKPPPIVLPELPQIVALVDQLREDIRALTQAILKVQQEGIKLRWR